MTTSAFQLPLPFLKTTVHTIKRIPRDDATPVSSSGAAEPSSTDESGPTSTSLIPTTSTELSSTDESGPTSVGIISTLPIIVTGSTISSRGLVPTVPISVPVSITSSGGLVPTIPLCVPVSTTSSRHVATTSSSISKTTQPFETSIPFPSVLSFPTTEHSTSATEVPTVRRVTSETSSDIGNAMFSMHLQSLTSLDNEGSTRTTSLTGTKGETAGTTMH
ncbi:hypothetical protein M422DRAFT_53535 [Sphaerobolus stellatus SS14]|uniref:Uncharacterized protein n=1 Tax=Sphaerobolus stellatus (strain SS14) TaxID=990650 RepID=A0A0C9U988_SPHS4|nr:hypothetical protein M422DRAFT_53535 [Sphaerobolus stellatus SS14]